MTRRLQRDEQGSTLVIALGFVTIFSLWLATVIGFASTGLKVSAGVESQRKGLYSYDAAIEGAIKALQPSNGASCADSMPSFPNVNDPLVAITVACESGASGDGPPVNVNNRPGQAVLTLSRTASETGFAKSVGSTQLKIHGGVFSNSNIAASGSIVVEKGNIRARTGCSGISLAPTTTTTVPAYTSNCALGTTADVTGDDPKIASPTSWRPAASGPPPAPSSLPSCNAVVSVQPGTYHDASVLNGWTNDNACKGSLIWFNPGTYYFDFNTGGSHVWTVSDPGNKGLMVVAGTPKGWTYTNPTTVTPVPAAGGSCKTEKDYPAGTYPANIGVQFIFGGDSQLQVSGGSMEVCAQPSTSAQQIGIYGLDGLAQLYGNPVPAPSNLFDPQSGCVTLVGGCKFLVTGPGNNSVLVVQGTIYAPAAALDLNMTNASITKFFGRGIIARTLQMSIPGSQSGNTSIAVPDFSPGTVTGAPFQEVLLTARLGGIPKLRVRVHFENTVPTPTVTILDWAVVR